MAEYQEFQMTEEEVESLLEACRPGPYMIFGGVEPRSAQENANDWWAALGRKMKFEYMTVQPDPQGRQRFFLAIPTTGEDI